MTLHWLEDTPPEVLIVGGGNAALCAAISAREAGSTHVVVIDSAPFDYRGGNTRHTRNFRCMHTAPLGTLEDRYETDEYLDDLLKVTAGHTDRHLARQSIERSEDCYRWLESNGVRFQPSLSGTLSLSRTNAFFLGGGKALLNALYRRAEQLGVRVLYACEALHLVIDDDRCVAIDVTLDGVPRRLSAHSYVLACGGFEANTAWLERAWGPPARNFLIRGTPYNRGRVLADLIDQGIATVGDPTQCHAVAIDGRAPKFDGGIATRVDCVPFSLVVNVNAERFYDEGEDVWPKRYAIWGRLIAQQPQQVAYSIIDARALPWFMPSVFPPLQAMSIGALAEQIGLDPVRLTQTVETFNAACPTIEHTEPFDPSTPDGVSTTGLHPPKSHWARPIITPPFYAYELRTGVTFTYLGVKVDASAAVHLADGRRTQNLWAAGEIMAGSLLGQGYLAGFGMTIGTVFGREAGKEAALHALRR